MFLKKHKYIYLRKNERPSHFYCNLLTVTALVSTQRRIAGKRAKVVEGLLQGQGADFYIVANAPPTPAPKIYSSCTWYTQYTI